MTGRRGSAAAGTVGFRPCALVPTLDNGQTVVDVVTRIQRHVADVIVVDDGSAAPTRAVLDDLEGREGVVLLRRSTNGGKGAACMDGLKKAARLGFTHAFQIDADGQHDLTAIPEFLELARRRPRATVTGIPTFDETAPRVRLRARRISAFFCHMVTLGPVVLDSLCGFRLYPLPLAANLPVRARRMDWDTEIAVRLVWAGVPVINHPVAVRYFTEAEGGVSHFHAFRDTLRIIALYAWLIVEGVTRLLGRAVGIGPAWSVRETSPRSMPHSEGA